MCKCLALGVQHFEGRVKAIVIFDTRFGSTEKIAKSIESGLKQTGFQTTCINAKDVNPESLKEHDIICVGAPTEVFSASKPIKEFLRKLKNLDLSGKYSLVFDTKVQSRLSGSGSKYIEKELKKLGLAPIMPRESAIVSPVRESGQFTGSTLAEGEEQRFEKIGIELGNTFLKIKEMIST